MTDVNCYCSKGQKRNVTKVEISGASKTYIVILSKLKKPLSVPKGLTLKTTKDYVSRHHENNSSILDLDNTNITVVVHKNKSDKEKTRNHRKHRTPFVTTDEYLKIMAKKRSTPDVHVEAYNDTRTTKKQRSDTYLNVSTSFRTQCIINTMTLDPTRVPEEYLALLRHPLVQAQLRICRQHFNEKNETCYRYCKSMTNLIKSLYDSHKEKHFNQHDILQLEKQAFSKDDDLPEIEVRETKDSICINPFAASAISEQKEEVIGVTNLTLLQPKATIQQNYKSCIKFPENKALTKKGVCMNRDMLLAKFKTTKSENLHEIKTAESHKCKPQSETTKALYQAFSLNDIIFLGGNAKLRSEGIDILVKKFGHVSKLFINSVKKEYYSKALCTEVIAVINEKGIQPLSEDIKKSEKSEINKEVNTKITAKKFSSEIFYRTGSASILIEKSFEQKEHLHQSFKKHSISLQEFKITLEKNIVKTMMTDFVIFSKNSNVPKKEIKAAELEGATILENSLINRVVESTSLDHLNSPIKKKEIVVNQTDEVIEKDKTDKGHRLSKDPETYLVTSLQTITQTNKPTKQKEGSSIPVLMHKKTRRKKHVEFVDDPSILTILKTNPTNAEYAKHQTYASSSNQKSALKKEKVVKSFPQKGKPLMSDRNKSKRGIFNEKKDDNTLTKTKTIGKPRSEIALQNNAFNNTIYSIFNSQVGQVKRRSKSLTDKPQGSQEFLKRQPQVENKSVCKKVSHIHESKSESESSWDKVLSNKIKDVLTVPKDPGLKLRNNRNPSFRYPAIEGNKTVQREKIINASQIKQNKGRATTPKTFIKNEEYPKVQLLKQFTSLDGKTALEKEKILRALIKKGKPLPEGRSKAEKALIDRVKAEAISKGHSSVTAPTIRKNK